MRQLKLNFIGFILLSTMALSLFSCEKKEKDITEPPVIVLDSQTGMYTIKVGKLLTISPSYENVEYASFSWSENGKIISTERELNFISNEVGDRFITLTAVNVAGETVMELKISVLEKVLPIITYTIPSDGISIMNGSPFTFEPTVENDEDATYEWYINGTKVADTKSFTYNPDTNGEYTVKYVVTNEDGSTEYTFKVKVCNPEDIPFRWFFERDTYYISEGRSIRIIPLGVENDFDATYTFKLNGSEVQSGKDKGYIFTGSKQGEYSVDVTMSNPYNTQTKSLKVVVCPPEGTYKRAATSSSSEVLNKVYEFMAAPGQFVNEGYTANTMEEAAAYAERRIFANPSQYVSLGAWGGYIVVGFDHSIENDGGYNIQIQGNAFNGSSEPGIVYVMQDENGNGLPDDTWYELKGSDYDIAIHDYAVTYYKPAVPGMPVQWTDNYGESGSIDYLGSFHSQPYYYPNWVTTETYTLFGTKLVSRTTQNASGIWINAGFEWGYVDNWSSVDMIDPTSSTSNHFKISDAVNWEGKAVNLKYIDFVKVQTGVNAKAGIIGENSTEVFNFKDYNMIK